MSEVAPKKSYSRADFRKALIFVRMLASGKVEPFNGDFVKRLNYAFSDLKKVDPARVSSEIADIARLIHQGRISPPLANDLSLRGRKKKPDNGASERIRAALPEAVDHLFRVKRVEVREVRSLDFDRKILRLCMTPRKAMLKMSPVERLVSYVQDVVRRAMPDGSPPARDAMAEMMMSTMAVRRPTDTKGGRLVVEGLETEEAILFPIEVVIGDDSKATVRKGILCLIDRDCGHMRWAHVSGSTTENSGKDTRIVISDDHWSPLGANFSPTTVMAFIPRVLIEPLKVTVEMSPGALDRIRDAGDAGKVNMRKIMAPLRRAGPGDRAIAGAMVWSALPEAARKAAQTLIAVKYTREWNALCPRDPVVANRRWQAATAMPFLASTLFTEWSRLEREAHYSQTGSALGNSQEPLARPGILTNVVRAIDEARKVGDLIKEMTGLRTGVLRRLLSMKWQRTGAAVTRMISGTLGNGFNFLNEFPIERLPRSKAEWKKAHSVAEGVKAIQSVSDRILGRQVAVQMDVWRDYAGADEGKDYGSIQDFLSRAPNPIVDTIAEAMAAEFPESAKGDIFYACWPAVAELFLGADGRDVRLEDVAKRDGDWHQRSRVISERYAEIKKSAMMARMGIEDAQTPPFLSPGGDWVAIDGKDRVVGELTWLTNSEALAEETKAMDHCVWSYADDAFRGSMLASIKCADGTRSTVEIKLADDGARFRRGDPPPDGQPAFTVIQHQAIKNGTPSDQCKQVLHLWLKEVAPSLDQEAIRQHIGVMRKHQGKAQFELTPEDALMALPPIVDLHRRFMHENTKGVSVEAILDSAREMITAKMAEDARGEEVDALEEVNAPVIAYARPMARTVEVGDYLPAPAF